MRRVIRIGIVTFALALLTLATVRAWGYLQLRAARRENALYHAEQSREYLDRYLGIWPHSREALLLAARAARRAEDFEAAQEYLDRCQERAESRRNALQLSHIHFRRIGTDDPVMEWALLRVNMGDLKDYEEVLRERAMRDAVAAPLIWEALAEGYLRASRILDAVVIVETWLSIDPDNVQALYLRGCIHRQTNATQKALPELRRAVEIDPEHRQARWALALVLLEHGYYDQAHDHLQYLRQKGRSDADLQVRLAQSLIPQGQTVQARQLLEAVLAAEPSHPLALRTRGQMAMTAGDLDDAEKWLREAARVAPNDYRTHYTLFQCLQQLGKQEEARSVEEHTRRLKDLLERAAEISTTRISNNPYDPALHAELGVINIHLGHKELGERWLLSALVQDPSYGPAYAALAELYEQQGDTAKAASYRRQARGAAPPAPGRPSPPPKP